MDFEIYIRDKSEACVALCQHVLYYECMNSYSVSFLPVLIAICLVIEFVAYNYKPRLSALIVMGLLPDT